MAVIRMRPSRPPPPARTVSLSLAGLAALQRQLAATDGPSLPADLRLEVSEVAAALAGVDVDQVLSEAEDALRGHGVLDDQGPVDSVVANLAALASSPRRIRTSLAGPDSHLLAYHWTGAEVGGSLVRDGESCMLSLFDARLLGQQVLELLPDPDDKEREDRSAFTVPLEALTTLAAADPVPSYLTEALGEFVGLDADMVTAVRAWSEQNRAVLHVTVSDPDPRRLPVMLVWFLDDRGWWSARTASRPGSERTVTMTPRRRGDLAAELGSLVAGALAVSEL